MTSFAQSDTFFVESNLLYVVKTSIKNIQKCKTSDVYSIAEIRVDSILYFQDTLVMKHHYFFMENARYVYFDQKKFNLRVDSSYFLNVFLAYGYSVFGINQMSTNPPVIYQEQAYGYNTDYPLGPNTYFKRRKLKQFIHVKILRRKSYYNLPKHKTHKVKEFTKPKFLNCIDDV